MTRKLAMVAVFLATTAGGGAVPAADEALVDPCGLVSRADVEQVVGRLKAAPKSGRNGRARVCEYELANGTDFLNVWLYPSASLTRFREQVSPIVPVPSLGQDAFLHHNVRFEQVQLLARKGNVALQVILTESSVAEERVKTIARKALSAL